jgi:hypothetical protein
MCLTSHWFHFDLDSGEALKTIAASHPGKQTSFEIQGLKEPFPTLILPGGFNP